MTVVGHRGQPPDGREYSGPRRPGPEYDSAVLREFRHALFEYAAVAAIHLRAGDRRNLRLQITVVTRYAVESIRDDLRVLARQTIDRDLSGAVLERITQVRGRELGTASCHVIISPPLPLPTTDPGPEPSAPAPIMPLDAVPTVPLVGPSTVPMTAGRGDPMLLTLTYGEQFRWAYPLLPMVSWIPLGRGLPAPVRSAGIRLPDHATPVPRGALLEVRCWDGRLDLRRTGQRREYLVSVDGVSLPPGGTVSAVPSGSLDYARDGQPSTTLRYRLSEED